MLQPLENREFANQAQQRRDLGGGDIANGNFHAKSSLLLLTAFLSTTPCPESSSTPLSVSLQPPPAAWRPPTEASDKMRVYSWPAPFPQHGTAGWRANLQSNRSTG